jgi:8-amino-7-oxononanoate synthase
VSTWTTWAEDQLASISSAGRFRQCIAFDGQGPRGVVNGREVVSFASNDYLGLTQHPMVREAAHAAIDRWGTGAGASRLVTGTRSLHRELEDEIARSHGAERALVFPTGFSANLGLVTTLGIADATLFSDQLNHASVIDGCRLARATTVIYRHLDMEHLESLLRATPGRKIILTETVFSMDGDVAPVAQLVELAARHGALLILDEAHAVLGPDVASPLEGAEVIRMGTLSKTLGSMGGWVCGPRALIDLLVNRARSFIYTTGLTPADAAAALAALRISVGEEGRALRARLRKSVDRIRPDHPSPIIPIVLGPEAAAVAASAALFEQGIHVPAIRPPTVPVGTARLRVALSAAHDDSMLDRLSSALQSIGISS